MADEIELVEQKCEVLINNCSEYFITAIIIILLCKHGKGNMKLKDIN